MVTTRPDFMSNSRGKHYNTHNYDSTRCLLAEPLWICGSLYFSFLLIVVFTQGSQRGVQWAAPEIELSGVWRIGHDKRHSTSFVY